MAPSRVDPAHRDGDDRDREDRPRHRRERAAYRFVEVRAAAGPGRLDGLTAGVGAFLVGTILGFLVLLGLGLVGGELVSGVRYDADDVLRSTMGWWILTLAVAVPVFVPAHAAATLAVTRALLAEDRPRTDVPPHSVRKRVAESSPAGALAGLAWTYLVLALLAGAVGLFAMDRDDAERTPTVVVSAVVGVVTATGLLLLPGLRTRWSAWQDVVRTTWGPNEVRFAEEAERRRRAALGPSAPVRPAGRTALGNDRAAAVLGGAGLVGLVLFLVGLWMRHPRKFGPDRYYGPVGEVSIDVLVGVGGALVGAALLVGAVWLLLPVSRQGRQRRAGLALLRSPEPSAPPADDVVRELLSPWSASTTVALVLLAGSGMLAPSVLASMSGGGVTLLVDAVPSAATAAVLVAVTLAALCVVVVGVARSARYRALVRERWHVGDDGPG
ncbi:hypothetical protein CBR64_11355 [Cellulosimicrobium cellulans]|uniref:Uncharacterized protein n=1 Tax=Cellulosimicrobium cellulans TaxID=1710 RepID=A0A1Y0HWU2_CELCE|nr:hypothetical protein [Cellulosimicrobium cellulans]ARU51986.1 hypothetical protein CBR64_11355 [Cellulosimicrobium cellulans]